jgi:hypothetical protein
MLNILYRYRNLTAAVAAVAIGACAFAVMPGAAGDLGKAVAIAAAPGCTGSQNPFIGSAARQNAGRTLSAHPALAQYLR